MGNLIVNNHNNGNSTTKNPLQRANTNHSRNTFEYTNNTNNNSPYKVGVDGTDHINESRLVKSINKKLNYSGIIDDSQKTYYNSPSRAKLIKKQV